LALVGVVAIAAAPLSGTLADRFGHRPVMIASSVFFGLGLLPTLFITNEYWLIGIVPGAFAAVVLITLPYSVLMGFLHGGTHHGAGAALFSVSRGFGLMLGVVLAGVAVELLRGIDDVGPFVFGETQGYAAIFPVVSVFLLASAPLLLRMNVDGRREAYSALQ
jgi:MFS family permease